MDDAKQIMHERFWELRKDWKLTLEQLEKIGRASCRERV